MAVATLKRLWKNEYFQTVMLIILMIVIVFGFWCGCQIALNTQYPALAVVSGSMLPTLNVGDIIIVQGVPASQINANYTTGDIVVYKRPTATDPEYRIVHRAVKKVQNPDGTWTITTKGDNNFGEDSPFDGSKLIGKVIARIPCIGNFVLFVNTLGNFYYFTILLIIAVNIIISLFFDTDEEKKTTKKESQEKKKLFGKLDTKMVFLILKIAFFLILNGLLIGFMVFNLFGSFTFYQIGADPPQYVTIHGMYPDVQFHESFKIIYNNVHKTFLSQGFLTYAISCSVSDGVHEGMRLGVPTFSWTQAAIIVLLMFDVWELVKFLKSKKTAETKTESNEIKDEAQKEEVDKTNYCFNDIITSLEYSLKIHGSFNIA